MTQLHISTAFDSGAIEVVSLADHRDIQLKIKPDNASEFAQWFHFRLQGAAGLPVSMRFLNAGSSAYPKGWPDYRVVASYDRQHWFRLPTSFDGQVMTTQLTPLAQSVYFAYFEPYSYERHLDLIGFATESDKVEVEHLGQTLDGRDMTLLRITDEESTTPLAQKKKVWLIARQHPGETMAEWFVEGFLERLVDSDDPVSRVLLGQCVFHVVPNMNPDGAARGNLRTNAAGANLNREWGNPTLERSPEVLLVRQKMQATGVDLFLDAHGDEALPYNFVAGCEGNPGYTPRLEALENAFKQAWISASPDFQDKFGYERDKAGEGNLTLATNWVGQNFDCLSYTIEMPFKDNANLPDEEYGWSGERSKKLGAGVLQPILAVLDQLR
ncbi:M14-type cytosolic carboxypeptidase [Chitinimonas viridis]|uniref:M14-type cytosolic carboxypeptidase n=1 Tax=Chitinimonas viridis TaxID=664880 RepID=A0ABT8B4G6_9NEIS|nr:M14-type cytosolic carboxypeptidase [Chitinimonas viridis]MDN3577008.1 M14-type cytosolic carboxypeptidase [Chitinimonas viridis]